MYSLTFETVSVGIQRARCGSTYLDEEYYGLPAVQQSMVVCECEIHHLQIFQPSASNNGRGLTYGANFDLAINSNGLFFDSM